MRQGCPLSPLLFSCVIETLVTAMASDSRLLGLPVSPGLRRVTVVPFADDVTFLASTTGEVDRTLVHIKSFERASGAKLNKATCLLLNLK